MDVLRMGSTSPVSIREKASTCMRQADMLTARVGEFAERLPPGLDGTQARIMVWHLIRAKRQTRGEVIVHPDYAARRAELVAGRGPEEYLLVEERSGRPYAEDRQGRVDEDRFQSRWGEVRAAAALVEPSIATLHYRDLRRTFGVLARAEGASVDDIADVLGNSAATDPALRDVYMPPTLDTGGRAVLAWRRPQPERKKA